MRRSTVFLLAAVALLTVGADECPPPGYNIITVETTEPGIVEDGLCSLAEAIENANTADPVPHPDCDPGDDSHRNRIVLGPELTYTLTEPFDEDYGLPEITGWVMIDGRKSIIERAEGAPEFGILRGSKWFELENVTIRDAAGNPGVSASNGLSIRYSKVTGCEVGIEHRSSGTLEVTDSTVRGNLTGIVNGCMYPPEYVGIRITRSTISHNRPGGGVVFKGCTEQSGLDVICSTFSSNGASRGGAISIDGGELDMTESTIVNNTGYSEGGGIAATSTVITAYRNIVAQNDGLNCSISDDTSVDSRRNLTDDDWCGFDDHSDMHVADAMLSELDYWGGPTLTHMPLEGSPAIDTAGPYCEHLDQRGYQRPIDGDGNGGAGCDRGAVEFGSKLPIDDQGDPIDPGPPPSSG